ncbi:Dihydropteroate synthase [Candidatus Sulfotelmatobacter kueseliae]|uniref:Dihydropteroate synthase n=1 Tax=Candidatus Sulfotelmatobacter kueseliae TaxID=2042962 RepID=A0A2U3KYH1_9BACT|nr:Dihydropteroate synthase [Candidatus Sulfotelmatobacter kueseliae]
MRPVFHWNLGSRSLELGKRTLIMGVVNVTPDSFSDGGLYLDRDQAIEQAERLLDEGADILDIGGESTRPGARVAPEVTTRREGHEFGVKPALSDRERSERESKGAAMRPKESSALAPEVSYPTVTAEEELRRVLPVITELKKKHPAAVLSVDTYKAAVARAAVNAGAEIVNDVSGFRWDPQMAKTVADLKCGAVLMHMRGRPEEWRTLPPPGDIVLLVKRELKEWAEKAVLAGVRRERIVLDPGFGFGKNFDENYPLLARFSELQAAGFPLLAGTSRKSFIGRTLATLSRNGDGVDAPPEARLYGTLATQVALILKGVHILRTHDVKPALEAARVADAILQAR